MQKLELGHTYGHIVYVGDLSYVNAIACLSMWM